MSSSITSFGPDNKRWAERARQAQYQELRAVRASAEQWRSGLAGLTALLSSAALITAPDLGRGLPQPWYALVGLLALAGLLTLAFGTWRAMRAAFGLPGKEMPLTGERLHVWEHSEARAAVRWLDQARRAFLAGILLIVGASVLAYAAQPNSGQQVLVSTSSAAFCGRLGPTMTGSIQLITSDGKLHTFSAASVTSVTTISAC